MKTKVFKEPIYQVHLTLLWDCTNDELFQWIKRYKNVELPDINNFDGGVFQLDSDNSRYFFLWLNKTNPGIIAHECLHTVFDILEYNGVKYDPDNQEPFTYYLQYWIELITKTILIK